MTQTTFIGYTFSPLEDISDTDIVFLIMSSSGIDHRGDHAGFNTLHGYKLAILMQQYSILADTDYYEKLPDKLKKHFNGVTAS